MRKLFTVLAAVILTASVFAQSPQKMSYQAVIRNSSNALVTSTAVGMRISILQGSATGTLVYLETQTPTTNANGLVSIEIGGGTGFDTINWANGPYFIKTETDPTGGTTYTITGTSQLLSVPYALHAKTAESISGGDSTHHVGELFGGGVIFYLWKDAGVEHGLIASLNDVSASAQWSSITGTLIGAAAQSPVDGQANTTAIVAQGDISGAAFICDNYSNGGFNDWYLPAAWELNNLYNAAFIINTVAGVTDLIFIASYWSSTEYDGGTAWYQNFYNGYALYANKGPLFRVRAVRRF
jgi:hypothetical protein